jgi:hypothetical protein
VTLPTLTLNVSLIGGTTTTLKAGSGAILRKAIASLANVTNATSTITSVTTSYQTTTVSALQSLGNTSAPLNASSTVAGNTTVVSPTDPSLNGPAITRRRRLQDASCSPIDLSSLNGTTTVPVTTAGLEIAIPASYFASVGAGTTAEMVAALEAVQAAVNLALNGTLTSSSSSLLSDFVTAWAACTGMPAYVGVIAGITAPIVSAVYANTASGPNAAVVGGVIGGIFGALVLALCAMCCWRACVYHPHDDSDSEDDEEYVPFPWLRKKARNPYDVPRKRCLAAARTVTPDGDVGPRFRNGVQHL